MKKGFRTEYDNKKYHKVRDHFHYTRIYSGSAHSICKLRYETPKEIPVVFYNGSIYDYHFIIKELPKQFEGQFEWEAENKKKYITFSVPKSLIIAKCVEKNPSKINKWVN